MAASGNAIFAALPLLFAIGVAIGLTDNDGVAALAGVVGYVVFLAALGICAKLRGIETSTIMGIPSIETGVFGGIIVGLIAAWAFNRFFKIRLPSYLGFFAGKRAVPIITAFSVIVVGAILSFIWPPIGNAIEAFSNWAVHGGPALAFTIYGVVERSLIPFGLHHVWIVPSSSRPANTRSRHGNVVRGEIARFIAGDPTAGNMDGRYLFKMWDYPPQRSRSGVPRDPSSATKVGGIMISGALTAFLTWHHRADRIRLPFRRPLLYAIHALLAGTPTSCAWRWASGTGFLLSRPDRLRRLYPKSHGARGSSCSVRFMPASTTASFRSRSVAST
jgi:PTS system glucose-specific IIC component